MRIECTLSVTFSMATTCSLTYFVDKKEFEIPPSSE